MKISNPRIPEGINSSNTHALVDFALLSAGVLLGLALLLGAIACAAKWAAPYVPYAWEVDIMATTAGDLFEGAPQREAERAYMQSLADALAANQDLPDGMQPTIHVIENPARNAFATLGGHVVVFSGLLDAMPSENALAMVLAHEIAHLRHRDPVTTMLRSLSTSLIIALVTGTADLGELQSLVGLSGSATLTAFSRSQEARADADAIASIAAHYGHVAGADWLFRKSNDEPSSQFGTFFATHPLESNRVKAMAEAATTAGWATEGMATPLPDW